MIDEEFLRSGADERARIGLLAAVSAWGVSAVGYTSGFAVVVFGSLVRGDYWSGSDLDIMPIGGTDADRNRAIDELAQLATRYGAKSTERWNALSSDYFKSLLAVPPKDRRAPYPPQFGLHGFDTIGHHVTILGHDPLIGVSFPEGSELKAHAAERMTGFNTKGHPWEDKAGDAAPEAIKAAVLLASVSKGLAPSRHKLTIVSLFEQLVPDFDCRARWKDVWRRYKNGVKGPVAGEVEFRDALIEAAKRIG